MLRLPISIIDPAEIGKIIAVDIPVVGDAKKALQQLLAEPTVHNNTEKWIEKVTQDKNRVRSYGQEERGCAATSCD